MPPQVRQGRSTTEKPCRCSRTANEWPSLRCPVKFPQVLDTGIIRNNKHKVVLPGWSKERKGHLFSRTFQEVSVTKVSFFRTKRKEMRTILVNNQLKVWWPFGKYDYCLMVSSSSHTPNHDFPGNRFCHCPAVCKAMTDCRISPGRRNPTLNVARSWCLICSECSRL